MVNAVTPKCSIVIRAYNEANHIGKLLDGISKQTEKDFEIILIDGTPNLSKMTTRIILASDLLLIPIRPGAQDVQTLKEFANRYEEAKAFKANIPAYFVMNEFSPLKRVHEVLLNLS